LIKKNNMGSVIDYKKCDCGNEEMSSDYYYKSDELYEFCDVCGHFYSRTIKNRPKTKEYPLDWKPEYAEKSGRTGYVIRVFTKESIGHVVTAIEKKYLKEALEDLKKDNNVDKFGVTFNKDGLYQTQIFKKINKK